MAKEKKSAVQKTSNAWSTLVNPLRSLTSTGISQLLEQVKQGNDVRLQIAFYETERTMPIFGICINKRLAGVTSRHWDILPMDESPEAKIQAEKIKKVFDRSDMRNTDGLTEALRHLALASFRGRSCVKPFINDNGELYFKKIQNWNTLEWNDKLYWNPTADQGIYFLDSYGKEQIPLQELTDDEVVWIKDERPIDIPGIQIYLRQLVGEENWAKAVERYGVAQIVITAPEGTPDSALNVWNQRAISLFEGGSGVLPPGADVKAMTEARGQDPFTAYINHQQEVIVLLACGEKLTTLGGPTGLGSDLASIQSQEFNNLVSYDCKRIANSMTKCAVHKCVKHFFPNQECKVRFDFVEDDNTTPDKYLEMATVVKNLGLAIDVEKLKELTGLNFISSVEKDLWTPERTEGQ